uniref:hypothetical protein n=1 Tax=Gemmiger formicilis TaxID=745368 RepID=UPI003FEFF9FF
FGCEFCFSNAEIMNVVANGLRGELVLVQTMLVRCPKNLDFTVFQKVSLSNLIFQSAWFPGNDCRCGGRDRQTGHHQRYVPFWP